MYCRTRAKINGTKEEKLEQLDKISYFSDIKEWRKSSSNWYAPFFPEAKGNYSKWPKITDLFPWQISGFQLKRIWPIAPHPKLLKKRWKTLLQRTSDKNDYFKPTRDRDIKKETTDIFYDKKLVPLEKLPPNASCPTIATIGYRSFDRQWVLLDNRLGDFFRKVLWHHHSEKQIYLTSRLTGPVGQGPAATISEEVPEMCYFRGSYGAKDVIPLWKDKDGSIPNITRGLLEYLSNIYGKTVKPEAFFSYCYAIMSCCNYTKEFFKELEIPPPRIPITADPELFFTTSYLGKELIWAHSFGKRFVPEGETEGNIPRGKAKVKCAIPLDPGNYPEDYHFNEGKETLYIGDGAIAPISSEVWDFQVSGLKPLAKWLDYRMKNPAGKKSSPLDKIFLKEWPHNFTEELLRLIWILEFTVEKQQELNLSLNEVLANDLLSAEVLPKPDGNEGKSPSYKLIPTSKKKALYDD